MKAALDALPGAREVEHPDGAFGGATHWPVVSHRKGSAHPSTSSQDVRQRFVFTSHRNGMQSVLLLPSAPMIV